MRNHPASHSSRVLQQPQPHGEREGLRPSRDRSRSPLPYAPCHKAASPLRLYPNNRQVSAYL